MKRIIDEFSNLPFSRQRKWQLRHRKAGLCAFCQTPATSGGWLCPIHFIQDRERKRKYTSAQRRYLNAKSYQKIP